MSVTQSKCKSVTLQSLKSEIDGYYRSFYKLDILTALIVLAVVADLSSLFFSYYLKELGAHEILTKVIITMNFILVGLIGFFGFWDIDWQFQAWEAYIEYGKCFEYPEIDRVLHKHISNEIDGARYMRIVRFITLRLFILLAAFYLYGMIKKRKVAKELRYRITKQSDEVLDKPKEPKPYKEAELQEQDRSANMSDLAGLKPGDSRLD
jgi:hypothetical protein